MTYRAPDYLPPASNLDELIIGWNTLRENGIPLDPGSSSVDGPFEWVKQASGDGRWLGLRASGGSNPFAWVSNVLDPSTQQSLDWNATNVPTSMTVWVAGQAWGTFQSSYRIYVLRYATSGSPPGSSGAGGNGSNDVPLDWNPNWAYSVAYELVQLRLIVANLIRDLKDKNVLQPAI